MFVHTMVIAGNFALAKSISFNIYIYIYIYNIYTHVRLLLEQFDETQLLHMKNAMYNLITKLSNTNLYIYIYEAVHKITIY